jgi:autoinducer 2-degrading protein
MILRLVKMHFKSDELDNFLTYFQTIKSHIEAMPGIVRLHLYQDKTNKNVVFTHSVWINEEYLNNYRKSELFAEVWPNTKQLFAQKAEAWSLELK